MHRVAAAWLITPLRQGTPGTAIPVTAPPEAAPVPKPWSARMEDELITVATRLVLALLAGGIIGFERTYRPTRRFPYPHPGLQFIHAAGTGLGLSMAVATGGAAGDAAY